jgi:hypothetical protein
MKRASEYGRENVHHYILTEEFYFIILSGVRLSPLGTAATTGLLYQPQMIDDGHCGAMGGIKIGRETEVLGEKVPRRHFVHHKFHITRPGLEPGLPRWEASDCQLELWHSLN